MLNYKKAGFTIPLVLIFMLLLSSCGQFNSEDKQGEVEVINTDGNEASHDLEEENKNGEMTESTGAFIQKDITPKGIADGRTIAFSQGKDSNYQLSIFDEETKEPRAFSYENGIWTEKNKESVLSLKEEKKITEATIFSDFADNWWILSIEDGMVLCHRIAPDGSIKELELSDFTEIVRISHIQLSEDGIISFSISKEEDLDTGMAEIDIVFIDTVTGELIPYLLPEAYYGVLINSGFMITDYYADTKTLFDIPTGEVVDSYNISDYPRDYSQNEDGAYYSFDNGGIYELDTTENSNQVIIDNLGFAYADPSLEIMSLLSDNKKDTTFMAVCEFSNSLKVYEYSYDKSVSTVKGQNLEIWSFEDMPVIRSAIAVFAREYPDCSINYDYGKSSDDTELTKEDIIRTLNTKLLAGEAPDVLFLDGLSIDGLHSQGLLSEINLELDQSQFYETILNSYVEGGVAYAYPTFFQVPVVVTTDPTLHIKEQNTLEGLSKLYENPNAIYNDWIFDLFNAFFYGSYDQLFPDNERVNEEELKEFLIHTKAMVDNQNMKAEPANLMGMSSAGTGTEIEIYDTPSLNGIAFDNKISGTGIIIRWSDLRMLFDNNEEIEILPLLGSSHINQMISSIPKDGKNKKMAENFIHILLQSDEVQTSFGAMGLPIKKGIGLELQKNQLDQSKYKDQMKYLDEFYSYDFDGLFNSLTKPCQEEYVIYDLVYEQASKFYLDEITIDNAVSTITQRLNLLYSERN